MEVETVSSADTQGTVDIGPDGKAVVSSTPTDGFIADITKVLSPEEKQALRDERQAALDKEVADETKALEAEGEEEAAGDEPAVEPEAEQPEAPGADDVVDLGDYNPEDPEVSAKFDERYFTEEGKLHEANLSAEYYANLKDPADPYSGHLNEGTYAYLEARTGVSKSAVQDIQEGLVARNLQKQQEAAVEVHAVAGGPEAYNAALEWAKTDDRYTPEARAAFDKVVRGREPGWEEKVELLISRHEKATGGVKAAAAPTPGRTPLGPPTQRRSTPARQAGTEHPKAAAVKKAADSKEEPTPETPAVVPYKDADEYYADLAKSEKGTEEERAVVRTRLRHSPTVWTA